jgi:hypothetical protein
MKNAIIICGQMRTYKSILISESYRKYLEKLGNFDVYINTWDTLGKSNNHGGYFKCDYLNNIITYYDIYNHYSQFEFFNIIDIQIESFTEWVNNLSPKLTEIYNMPYLNHSNNTTSLPLSYKYQQSIKQLILNKRCEYEKIFLMRPDTQIVNDIDWINFNNTNTLYFHTLNPRCVDHGWIIDQKSAILMFSSIYDDYINIYNLIPPVGAHPHMNRDINEIIIYQANKNNITLKHNNIQIFNIIIYL